MSKRVRSTVDQLHSCV